MTDKERARSFYNRDNWVEANWVDLISVEYEELLAAYPFPDVLYSLARDGAVRLLDVGCGTGIFPRFLDEQLANEVLIRADLLDLSPISLRRCQLVLRSLEHFQIGSSHRLEIESVPNALPPENHQFDVIWALHSLTTVERERMPDVLAHLMRLLVPGGRMLIYQLARPSTYQLLHAHYRENCRPHGDLERFMQAEDTVEILNALGFLPRVWPLEFEHHVPRDDRRLLQLYLRKCVLDESLDAVRYLEPILAPFLDRARNFYRIPQTVHLIEVERA